MSLNRDINQKEHYISTVKNNFHKTFQNEENQYLITFLYHFLQIPKYKHNRLFIWRESKSNFFPQTAVQIAEVDASDSPCLYKS